MNHEIKLIGEVNTGTIKNENSGVSIKYYNDKTIFLSGFYDSWGDGAFGTEQEEFTLKEFILKLGITLEDLQDIFK